MTCCWIRTGGGGSRIDRKMKSRSAWTVSSGSRLTAQAGGLICPRRADGIRRSRTARTESFGMKCIRDGYPVRLFDYCGGTGGVVFL
jgi:hypothetical protein